MLILCGAATMFGQVEKVAMRTTGISCGTCAAVSEFAFRRLPGVEKVTISRSNEAVLIYYKNGVAFNPEQLRGVLKPLDVGVAQFQISARGRIQKEGAKLVFIAGADKFVLAGTADVAKAPLATPVILEGIVNDQAKPMELKMLTFRPVQ
jgi:hypothetical protein